MVTSQDGAAWHDILKVSGERNPLVPIVLVPAGVQGERAAAEIAAGIRIANEQTDADVLIVTRGGGSTENLWCFNDEAVVRAVAASRIPVVSGVGHEIDTTLIDLAADVCAVTPTNAAEYVFPDRKELRGRIGALALGLCRAAEGECTKASVRVRESLFRLSALSPEKRIANLVSGSGLRKAELVHAMRLRMEGAAGQVREAGKELEGAAKRRGDAAEADLLRMREKLEAISPLRVLERGYTLVTDRNGKVLTGKQQAEDAEDVRIRFADGTVEAAVRKGGVRNDGE